MQRTIQRWVPWFMIAACIFISFDSEDLAALCGELFVLTFKLFCVFSHQPLPARGFHDVGAEDASNRRSCQEMIKHFEADVPSRSPPGYEATIDVRPQRQARAGRNRFEFPALIAVLKHLGSVS